MEVLPLTAGNKKAECLCCWLLFVSASSLVDIDLALLRPHLQLHVDMAVAVEQTYVSCDDRSGGETLAVPVCEEARANTVTVIGKQSLSLSSVC